MSGLYLAAAEAAPFTLDPTTVEALTGATWHGARHAVTIRGAVLDSRAARPGGLFVAIQGERVDGHDFAATAVGAGAVLVLAQRPLALPVPVLVAADPAAALLALAAEFRRRFTGATWIAVGGANGKTTTKDLLAAACRGSGASVHVTAGNLNNHLGVPLTILATPAGTRYAIIEVGTNHPGEIAPLAAAVQPDVAVVTSIGPEHLEGFGDLAGVAREEATLLAALPAGAPCFAGLHGLPGHAAAHGARVDDLVALLTAPAAGRALTLLDDGSHPTGHGDAPAGRVASLSIRLDTPAGSAELPLPGAHNLSNATLAYRAAVAAGVTPVQALAGLSRAVPSAGRCQPKAWGPHLIIDDTYNANPASMIAGLAVLAGCPGERLAVLGRMGELGTSEAEGHRQVGAEAARLGLPLITVRAPEMAAGYRSAGGTDLVAAEDHLAATTAVRARLVRRPVPTTILVKASRSQALERVVNALLTAPC